MLQEVTVMEIKIAKIVIAAVVEIVIAIVAGK